MSALDLLPPHSVEAEQGLLGGVLLDNEAWDLIADQIQADDFFRSEHKSIFRAITALAEKNSPFDVVTLSDSMADLDQIGGLGYIAELAKNTPSVANIQHYAMIVRNRAHLRRLMSLGFHCSRAAADDQAEAAVVQDEIEQQLFKLGEGQVQSEFADIKNVLFSVVDKIDAHFNGNVTVTGVPTGITDLDTLTRGFQPADLIILGARPSMGKTSFALNIVDAALNSAPAEQTVQVYSMEMPTEALIYRLLAILGHMDLGKLLNGQLEDEDWSRLTSAVKKVDDFGTRLVIDDTSNLTPAALRAKARRAARRFGPPALLMVDYLQLMRSPGQENRANEISEISRSLKALAKEFNCPVVALSQLNRDLERRPNKRPISADLRDSGAIEQDADVILFVYRDEVYHPETEHKGIAEIIAAKHRNGACGTVRTAFIPHQTRFANLSANVDWQGARA
ncbi:replicative DNA helicase [Pseudomonas sp. 21LCFQ02]|uniref:replicative DNA helicase n=1 Tax=Pseudomonas sp. 21LCFQ02 TaxID=2957505 RepID=UPI00209AE9C1|nr:replicative DNA helicase [Pseudomonas sp. 21LCFQ02]MCO8171168.1 replicative DNA helicase [Pseudomonas sp. 21LCFQ02]